MTVKVAGSPSGSGSSGAGTFANKPASPSIGTTYFANDLGTGVEIIWTGTKWKPTGGIAVIGLVVSSTGFTFNAAEQNFTSVKVPAGLLSSTGNLRYYFETYFSGVAAGKSFVVRHNTTQGATTGGATLLSSSLGSSAGTLSAKTMGNIHNNASITSQITTASPSESNVSSSAITTGSIDTAADSYINFNVIGTSPDALSAYMAYLYWVEN